MPTMREKEDHLNIVISAHVDPHLLERIEKVMRRLGLKTRAELVRMALKSFIDRHIHTVTKCLIMASPSLLQFREWLPRALIIASLTVIAVIIFEFVQLMRAESEQETARAQKIIGGCIIGGVLTALARNIAQWITGYSYDPSAGVWKDASGNIVDIPEGMAQMTDKLLTLLTIIGVVVVIAGLIWGGIQLAHKRND